MREHDRWSRQSSLYKIVLARFLARGGSEAAFFIGVWGKAAFVLQATPAQLALVMFSLSLSMIAGTALGGVLVDRYGPKNVLVWAHVAFVPAAVAVLFASSIPQLAALVAVWGFLGAPVLTAGASFAPFLGETEEEVKRANALIEGAGSAAFVIGPAVGALIARYADVNAVFLVDAASSLVAAVVVLLTPLRPFVSEGVRRHAVAEVAEGLRVSFSLRGVRYYVLAGALVWLGYGSFGALEPLFFRDVVGTGIEAIGWVNSVFGAGFVLGALALSRLPARRVTAVTLGGAVVAVAVSGVGYVATPDLRVVAVAAVAFGAAAGFFVPLQRTLIHRDAPRALVGRIVGTSEMLNRGGEMLPLAFAPLAAAAFGVQPTLIGGLAIVLVIALVSLPAASRIDSSGHRRLAEPEPVHLATDEPISPMP